MANLFQLKKLGSTIILLAVLVIVLVIAILNNGKMNDIAMENAPDKCLSCHADENDMSSAHPNKTFGCKICHLGNPDATDKDIAHAGMVINPSNLHWINKTCGQSECHADISHAVKNSIMTTNSGLIASTLYQWGERSILSDTLLNIETLPDTSLATSHIRKLCAGCHVNKLQGDIPGEFGERGGGCNDCHLVAKLGSQIHPILTVEIGIDKCEKCHNRSNRTALNYQGKFESEGYGTPYEAGNFSSDTLSGARFWYPIPADVHFEAGMVCIDCHTAEDVMGDGKRYAHLENQVHITCKDCHQMQTGKPEQDDWLWKTISVNKNLKIPADSLFARTGLGTFFSNVFKKKNQAVLIKKLDGKELSVKQIGNRSECMMPGHERLSCQSCHSAYTPQCYGCHDLYDPGEKQLDKISYEETYGHWEEGRSYLRFEEPALGLDQFGKIMPFAPGCQVYLTALDKKSKPEHQNTWLTAAAFDPHITRTKVPKCIDCHGTPKRMGIGQGNLTLEKAMFTFSSDYDPHKSGLGSVPLESLVNPDGNPLQVMSRVGERPFNKSEIRRIYRVSLCITCHDQYNDSIYQDFHGSIERYFNDRNLPCRNN